jgi:hypothetical protein
MEARFSRSREKSELKGRLETASTRGFTHLRGFKTLNFSLVRVGGLCLCSREFYSPGL